MLSLLTLKQVFAHWVEVKVSEINSDYDKCSYDLQSSEGVLHETVI